MSDRLDINMIDNKDKKKGEGTRADLRKKENKEKELIGKHDASVTRDFTTDQANRNREFGSSKRDND